MGIALAPKMLAVAELASGALIAPSSIELKLARPYCAVYAHTRQDDRYLRRFIDWLISES